MELRPGRADDMEAIIELRRDCYPSSPGPEDLRQRYLCNPRFRLEDALWSGSQPLGRGSDSGANRQCWLRPMGA